MIQHRYQANLRLERIQLLQQLPVSLIRKAKLETNSTVMPYLAILEIPSSTLAAFS